MLLDDGPESEGESGMGAERGDGTRSAFTIEILRLTQ